MGITEEIASTHLGKPFIENGEYNPSLLVAIPRQENRNQYDIDSDNLPFYGFDIWHAYEFSTMTKNGLPITRLLKIKYNCENKYLIESKSLKLYLNSFNLMKFGANTTECLYVCKNLIKETLSEKLDTEVEINFIDNKTKPTEIYANYNNLYDYIDEYSFTTEHLKESPKLLQTEQLKENKIYRLQFDALRSNCRVTHQPDFGDVFIYYKSSKHIIEESLIKYLTSFRSEYHFHEECCEMIYKRLSDILDKDDELFVSALYTRRGGIDICPTRWSKNCSVKDADELFNLNRLTKNGVKQ